MQKPLHLLLVEDNAAHAKLATLAIQDGSVDVTVDRVVDGEQALAYLHRQAPYENHPDVDLVLLDLRAPRMDGTEVLRRVKSNPELRSIPVIVLSSTLSREEIEAAYRNYANSFLIKPLDFSQFQQMMKDLLTYWGTWNQPR